MTTKIKTWQIVDGQLEDVATSLTEQGKTEAFDLESWIVSNPSIIGHNLTVLGRQVQTRSGPLDILAVDGSGNLTRSRGLSGSGVWQRFHFGNRALPYQAGYRLVCRVLKFSLLCTQRLELGKEQP